MPEALSKPLPDLAALVAHYRDLLGLRDWSIEAEWCEDLPGAYAQVIPLPERRMARILVSTACPPEELRATVAHELVHVLISPLAAVAEPSAGAVMLEEQAVEALAVALTTAERTPVDAAVMRRVFADLPARLRARLSLAPARRRRSWMDPELVKKVIEALEAGNGESALKMLKEMLIAAASGGEHVEPDGDEAPLAAEPPPADAAADEDEKPAKYEAPPPGDKDDEDDEGEKKPKGRASIDPVRALGALVMERLKEPSALRAKGRIGALLDQAETAAAGVAKARSEAEAIKRERLWEDAVRDGRVQFPMAFKRATGKDGKPRRVYADWAKAQNSAYPEFESFEAWIKARVAEPGALRMEPSAVLANADEDARDRRVALSERDKQRARRAGVSVEELEAALSRQSGVRAAEGV